jgi:hypothetical protein
MRFNQGFDVILAEKDTASVTPHDGGTVSLHGYGGDGIGCNTWSVQFVPCEKHIAALKKLLAALEERFAMAEAQKGNGR